MCTKNLDVHGHLDMFLQSLHFEDIKKTRELAKHFYQTCHERDNYLQMSSIDLRDAPVGVKKTIVLICNPGKHGTVLVLTVTMQNKS